MSTSISRNLCSDCCKIQESCCSFGYPPLMLSDIKTIESLGFKLKDFAEISEYSPEELEGEDVWWIKSMIKLDDKYFKVAIKRQGKFCMFLQEGKGCTLAHQRPLICQIYPFWAEKGRLVPCPDCYIVRNNLPLKSIMEMIGETETSLNMKCAQFKEDAITNYNSHKKIVHELYNHNSITPIKKQN